MLRVVADSDVFISAFNFGGKGSKVLKLAQQEYFILFISAPILDEVRRVLAKKFLWPEKQIRLALANIGEYSTFVVPAETLSVIKEDPADNRILECAQKAAAHFIVTGDKHLLKLKCFRASSIIRVAHFLELKAWQERE
jgi:putative PIN family toxin of toxin-antitoxin system